MSLFNVTGQNKIAELLSSSIKEKRVFHAYIFNGSEGTGKTKMALEFAKALNCEEETGDACGRCLNCKRIEHNNHQDVKWVKPDGNSLKIEQVRQLQKDSKYKKIKTTKSKTYIIEQADLLTNQAANSLLKFLEEPENDSVIILITENQNNLLPTIRSRCQTVYFSKLNPANIVEILKKEGFKEDDILLAAHLTQDISKIRTILKTEQFAQMRNIVLQWSEDVLNKKYQTLLSIEDKIIKDDYIKEQLPNFLDLLLIWYRDILNIKIERKESIINKEYQDNLLKQALHLTEDKILDNIDVILKTKKKLLSPVNQKLVLEQLVLSLWEG